MAASAKGEDLHTTLRTAEVTKPWCTHIHVSGSWLGMSSAFVLAGGWAGAQVNSLLPLCRSLELDVISLPPATGGGADHSIQHFQSLVSQIFKQREVIAILVTTCI